MLDAMERNAKGTIIKGTSTEDVEVKYSSLNNV